MNAQVWLAEALRRQGRNAEAAGRYAVILERDPRQVRLRLRHALALEAAADPLEALKSLEATMRPHSRAIEPRILATRLLATGEAPHEPERAV